MKQPGDHLPTEVSPQPITISSAHTLDKWCAWSMNLGSRMHTKIVKGLLRLLLVTAFQCSPSCISGVLFFCPSGFNCSQISTVIYSTLAWPVYSSGSINIFLLLSSHYNELCFSIIIFLINHCLMSLFSQCYFLVTCGLDYILVLYCKEKLQILNWFVLFLFCFVFCFLSYSTIWE